jgi:predicted kinase
VATPRGRLIIVSGLPGAGKTTRAVALAQRTGGVCFSPDDWMDILGLNLWDLDGRRGVEELQRRMAQQLIGLGGTAILEWGTWSRAERDMLREGARALGAAVELVFVDAPPEVLFERVSARGREDPPITLEQLREYSAAIERPTADELALYDSAEASP